MTLRDVGLFLRGRLNRSVSRLANARASRTPLSTAPLESVLGRPGSPEELVPLLEGRSNPERQVVLARHLTARGIPFRRHAFKTLEGAGENFEVDLGGGDRLLVLIAHHDAVPGSPGANDNAASVGILLQVIDRLASSPPPGLRVRLLFTAAEEIGYLGARAYVSATDLSGVTGVLSLELCGIGDSLVVWDAGPETDFLRKVTGPLDGLGLRRDEGYHVVGRIPVFGSDHRAFAAAGVDGAYGFTSVPAAEAAALRQFVFHPVRSALRASVSRPPPFDTYHTSRDAGVTLEAAALERMMTALAAVVEAA